MLNLSYFVVGFCIRSMCIALSSFFCLNSSLFACNDDLPNIVFILSDDHRWDQMGCAGHEIVRTPNIDRLAADGVRFKNMFVTTSICAASRASIFTGMYERGHRFTFGTKPLAKTLVDSSYPVLLKNAGYRTGFVGKFGVALAKMSLGLGRFLGGYFCYLEFLLQVL